VNTTEPKEIEFTFQNLANTTPVYSNVLQGSLTLIKKNGVVHQNDLNVVGTPGGGMLVLATTEYIEQGPIENRQVKFEIFFRECIIGERLTEAGVCEYCKGP